MKGKTGCYILSHLIGVHLRLKLEYLKLNIRLVILAPD